MAPKRAKYYSYGDDTLCVETKEFIEKAGVLLDVRDIEKQPLSILEMQRLFGHMNIKHFLNTLSESYAKLQLDKNLPPREEILQLMADDHTLIRRPIIKSLRLVTAGCDKRKIAQMFQISANGSAAQEDGNSYNSRRNRNNREAAAASGK